MPYDAPKLNTPLLHGAYPSIATVKTSLECAGGTSTAKSHTKTNKLVSSTMDIKTLFIYAQINLYSLHIPWF